MPEMAAKNTDRELYRENTGNEAGSFYENSLHVTELGNIGMNVGGHVFVHSIDEWHRLSAAEFLRNGTCTCVPDSPNRCGYCALNDRYGETSDDADARVSERAERVVCLRTAIEALAPVWANRGDTDIADAILCARYIETGRDPYIDHSLPSPDAMRSHP